MADRIIHHSAETDVHVHEVCAMCIDLAERVDILAERVETLAETARVSAEAAAEAAADAELAAAEALAAATEPADEKPDEPVTAV